MRNASGIPRGYTRAFVGRGAMGTRSPSFGQSKQTNRTIRPCSHRRSMRSKLAREMEYHTNAKELSPTSETNVSLRDVSSF